MHKDVVKFDDEFQVVTFSNGNCEMCADILNGKLQVGDMTHRLGPAAPTATVYADGSASLNFSKIPISFDNWDKIKQYTEEMRDFLAEVLEEIRKDAEVELSE